jgi:5-methyltetrahydropteroyltriglutamate--homocysteine methyltransferase
MRRSTDRILTTHVGALQRPAELSRAMSAQGQWSPDVLGLLRASVADVVRRQADTGIDIVDDGEFGKTMWSWYIRDRLDGIERRDLARSEVVTGRDRANFPGFYAWAEANASLFGYMEDSYFWSSNATQPVVTGPVRYRPEAVRRDIANLKDALAADLAAEAFLPVVAPASVEVGLANEYYGSHDDATNIIEHPELVAERITRYTDRLGAQNVIAGADCGFGSRIHPELGWAKMSALAEGAALASSRIWTA